MSGWIPIRTTHQLWRQQYWTMSTVQRHVQWPPERSGPNWTSNYFVKHLLLKGWGLTNCDVTYYTAKGRAIIATQKRGRWTMCLATANIKSSHWPTPLRLHSHFILCLCLVKHLAAKSYAGAVARLHAFLTTASHVGEWSASCCARFTLSTPLHEGTWWLQTGRSRVRFPIVS